MKQPLDPSQSDAHLWEGIRVRQTTALKVLYERHAGVVYGLALRILQDTREAEDVTQEIFTTLWVQCSYQPDLGPLKSYLLMMTRSRALDRVRARSRKLKVLERWGRLNPLEAAPTNLLEEVSLAECAVHVRAAMSQLPANQRQTLELTFFDGFSCPEIARRLGVPLGTVKSWSRLGLLKLRRSLQGLLG
ncbi:sigma-70 family RNA polymerase sigma factor [Candidatus Cyanaurora vandensis]|uniref:sigma-70 family RNA polymerase sigma factor n=1 Tax=Candidatus Cyanaurora vandensis TaxID=2714958 RepID=UPI00257AA87F|nr:sigma-70 family RNA polymerase sigma factor [Candidatus Cyanaurora vandensis]